SKDGGLHWGPPVLLQDDMLGGLNDKNWIVVDNSDAPGHHQGRVYVVWDRIAPILYDYCDHDCDRLSNWLPDFQTIPGLVFPGQGVGAYPVVMKNGGLGIVMNTITGGVPVPSGPDELDAQANEQVFTAAPAAGTTPYPAPLVFTPPVDVAGNQSNGQPTQRAGDRPVLPGPLRRRQYLDGAAEGRQGGLEPLLRRLLARRLVRGRLQRARVRGRLHVHSALPGTASLRGQAGAADPEPPRFEHPRADRSRQGPPTPEHLGRAGSLS